MINRITLLGYYALRCVQAWVIVNIIAIAVALLALPIAFVLPGAVVTDFFLFMAVLFFAVNMTLGYARWYLPAPMDPRAAYPEDDLT